MLAPALPSLDNPSVLSVQLRVDVWTPTLHDSFSKAYAL